jgi:hypothetical protein
MQAGAKNSDGLEIMVIWGVSQGWKETGAVHINLYWYQYCYTTAGRKFNASKGVAIRKLVEQLLKHICGNPNESLRKTA